MTFNVHNYCLLFYCVYAIVQHKT